MTDRHQGNVRVRVLNSPSALESALPKIKILIFPANGGHLADPPHPLTVYKTLKKSGFLFWAAHNAAQWMNLMTESVKQRASTRCLLKSYYH